MLKLSLPSEITYLEVISYWERLRERTWSLGYSVFKNPNRNLKAIVNDRKRMIAVLWDMRSGKLYQNNQEPGSDLMEVLGYKPALRQILCANCGHEIRWVEVGTRWEHVRPPRDNLCGTHWICGCGCLTPEPKDKEAS